MILATLVLSSPAPVPEGAIQIPADLLERQYIYCVDRRGKSNETIQIDFRIERVSLLRDRVKEYRANPNGEKLLKLPQFERHVANYLTSQEPVYRWRIDTALAAWKSWSSDRRYHTVTLDGINYICSVNINR